MLFPAQKSLPAPHLPSKAQTSQPRGQILQDWSFAQYPTSSLMAPLSVVS